MIDLALLQEMLAHLDASPHPQLRAYAQRLREQYRAYLVNTRGGIA